ncbi:MAG: ABC transporter ATP-binding protein [Clostridiales bacterium]|jgi:fluoroquinolone transport system ATP-binding protein|nr:ABC transporter ATP-binding protein [Clostridiales bacterium]
MLTAENLSFSYSKKPFIENMSFHVGKGEIFGFLGPSGAGKTTLQKILTGLITSYRGSVRLCGVECKKHGSHFYENIGVDFEFSTLYEKLTARQNLIFFSSLYTRKVRPVDNMLARVGLQNDADKRVSEYSKGMKSRLNFIKALMHDPEVLFLDEPTSGLDPTNSRLMKDMILQEKATGKTIFLTTHNMMDAAELCGRVAFIVNGSIKALDSPHNLIMRKGAAKIKYLYYDGQERTGECLLSNTSSDSALLQLMRENRILSIHSSEPTLNDIFIDITGRTLQ